ENLQCLEIDSRLGQPHPFRLSSKPMLKVSEAPLDLGLLVPPSCQRQNQMIVSLRDGRSVSSKRLRTFGIGLHDRSIDVPCILLEPRQQSRSEVEANPLVVVDDL